MVKAHYGLLALALEALTTQEINPAIYSQLLQFLSRYHLQCLIEYRLPRVYRR